MIHTEIIGKSIQPEVGDTGNNIDPSPSTTEISVEKKSEPHTPSAKPSLDTIKSAEWIVVTEKSKKKASSPIVPIQEKRLSTITKSPNNKPKAKRNHKKAAKKSGSSPVIKNNNHQNKASGTPVSPNLAWSNIVKARDNEPEVLHQDDVPFLSDNDSVTGSVESPCLSHRDLFTSTTTDEAKLYSPFFSTAFDFGVLPPSQPPQKSNVQPISNINSRLDAYLNSQQQESYTPSHKQSLLYLLNAPEQVETTITPACFKYFDDMMMSNSLYKTHEHNKTFSLMNEKRDWESISHSVR